MPVEIPGIAVWMKPSVMVVLLALLWSWESIHPFFDQFRARRERLRHAGRNLAITLFNTAVLAVLFATATLTVVEWTARNHAGLLNAATMPAAANWAAALLLLDGWLYVWHRVNHRIPFLWRFHRMHHSDPSMDVTTATRFHLGEHVMASTLRLGLIPLFGVSLMHLAVYDTLVIANTLIHHSNISLGRWDRPLRALIVTPAVHKMHHSRFRPETDSNYATIFSFWDRAARTFRMREDVGTIEFGLDDFDDPRWQTCRGMLKTPLVASVRRMHGADSAPPSQAVEIRPESGRGGSNPT